MFLCFVLCVNVFTLKCFFFNNVRLLLSKKALRKLFLVYCTTPEVPCTRLLQLDNDLPPGQRHPSPLRVDRAAGKEEDRPA